MEIEAEDAAAVVTEGDEAYYFCSAACRDQFVKEPERWLEPEVDEEEGGPATIADA